MEDLLLIIVAIFFVLIFGFCLGRYSAAKDCDDMGFFLFKGKVYRCEKIVDLIKSNK